MGRLIDADYALKILTEDWFLEIILTTWGKSDAKEEIENALNRVETAYDVEAVVAELEAFARENDREPNAGFIDMCIEIVRGKE